MTIGGTGPEAEGRTGDEFEFSGFMEAVWSRRAQHSWQTTSPRQEMAEYCKYYSNLNPTSMTSSFLGVYNYATP